MPGLHAVQGDDAKSMFATVRDRTPAEIPPFQARKAGDGESAGEPKPFPLTSELTATTVLHVQQLALHSNLASPLDAQRSLRRPSGLILSRPIDLSKRDRVLARPERFP
jgi:hypothetical protein